MAFPLPSLSLRPLALCLGLSTTAVFATQTLRQRQRPLLCEAISGTTSPATSRASEAVRSYSRDAKVPIFKNGGLNRDAFGQLSAGSVCGLLGGLAVSTFSTSLALLLGLMIFGVQYLESKGYRVIPRATIQRYVTSMDLRSALEDNVAFKLSFGSTFVLASFAKL